jgi:hypothetical protein
MPPEPPNRSQNVRYILMIGAALLLAGCVSSQACGTSLEFVSDETTLNVDRSLILHEPCAPPCWQGITPDISTADDALSLLQNSPYIDPNSISTRTEDSEVSTIYWDTAYFERLGKLTIGDGGTVERISVLTDYGITLDQLIATFGTPASVSTINISIDTPACYLVSFFWPEHGLVVTGEMLPGGASVSGSLSIWQVNYVITTEDGRIRCSRSDEPMEICFTTWVPWEGSTAIELP